MKSIHKAFGDYLSIEIERDRNVNNIIVAQACRHAIAHNGEIVDSKLIYQIRDSNPRDIQSALVEGNKIKFSPEEVDIVADEMKTYIDKLLIKIFDKHSF